MLNDKDNILYKEIYRGFVEIVNEEREKEFAILLADPQHFNILADAKFGFVDATFGIEVWGSINCYFFKLSGMECLCQCLGP